MDQQILAKLAGRVQEARMDLLRIAPFWGSLTMQLKLDFQNCGTAYTDGRNIRLDPAFLAGMQDPEEFMFILLHETLHCALFHLQRQRDRNHELFNIAADIVVNSMALKTLGVPELRLSGSPVVHTFQRKEGLEYSAEELYDLLLQKFPKGAGSIPPQDDGTDLKQGARVDDHNAWENAVCTDPGMEGHWKAVIKTSADVSANWELRQWLRLDDPPQDVPWREILQEFLAGGICDYTFSRPDRRYQGPVIIPGFYPELTAMENIWFVVDTSSSIGEVELEIAMNEVLSALETLGGSAWISFFTTDVSDPVPFESVDELLDVKVPGRGGTSFHVIFQKLDELPFRPAAIVILTDGFAEYPDEEDSLGVPTLWLIQKEGRREEPDWGTVARFTIE